MLLNKIRIMDLTKLELDEIFLLLAFVNEALVSEKSVHLEKKKDKLRQEILNRLDKI